MNHMTLRRVVETLPRFSYRFANEDQLQAGIAEVLKREGISFQREVIAGPQDRFDFLIEDDIVIEAKVKGSMSPALQQIRRYAARVDVGAVVLVTTRYWGLTRAVNELHGKPVRIVKLRGDSF